MAVHSRQNTEGFRVVQEVFARHMGVSLDALKDMLDRAALHLADEMRVAVADDELRDASDATLYPSWPGHRVAVVGAGVAGLTAAQELRERGFEVDVFECLDEPGGKSRSVDVPGSATNGRRALPGEHGFRFFPSFYTHLRDSLARIRCADGSDVLSRLVPTQSVSYVARESGERVERTDGIEARDVARYLADESYTWANLRFMSACNARRREQFENLAMADLCPSGEFAKLPKLLVACSAREISARTALMILSQLNSGRLRPVSDALLDGPSSERWFEPWIAQLRTLGVRFHFGHRLSGVTMKDGAVDELDLELRDGSRKSVRSDHVVLALPLEVVVSLTQQCPPLRAADPCFQSLAALRTDWMAGLQYYFDSDLQFRAGHYVFSESPWAITAIDQAASWRDVDFTQRGDGRVRSVLSVIISDFSTPGLRVRKPAKECSEAELLEEALFQIRSSFAAQATQSSALAEQHLLRSYVGPGLRFAEAPHAPGTFTVQNSTPLFVNTVDSFKNRPRASSTIPNLYLASDYIQTNTDLACMESANEAARRAVNALLTRAGSMAPRCAIFALEEGAGVGMLKAVDRLLFERGQPGLFDALTADSRRKLLDLLHATPEFVGAAASVSSDKARQADFRNMRTFSHLLSQLDVQTACDLLDSALPAVNPLFAAASDQDVPDTGSRVSEVRALRPQARGTVSVVEPGALISRIQYVHAEAWVIADVRDARAFARQHLLQAVHAPACEGPDLAALTEKLLAHRERVGGQEIVLYAEHSIDPGSWGAQLADVLIAHDVHVRILAGGYERFCRLYPHALTGAEPSYESAYFSAGSELPSIVVDGFLFLGDRHHAGDLELLSKLGITHVFNVTREVSNFFEDRLMYRRIAIDDDADCPLLPHLQDAVDALTEIAKSPGSRVLVHCRLGLSRSASIVLAYLMASRRIHLELALEQLTERRLAVSPNRAFLDQLESFQESLGISGGVRGSWRPPLHIPDLPACLAAEPLPRHIAFIMDGNRRWTLARGRREGDGHRAGRETAERVVRTMARWGIRAVSLYAFSTENWSRSETELLTLFDTLEIGIAHMRAVLHEEDVRLHVAGNLDDPRIPDNLRSMCRIVEEETRSHSRCLLTMAINYGGRQEIAQAFNRLSPSERATLDVSEAAISRKLSELSPAGDIDLLVRTSGEQRLSNFMLWQASYAELYFTDKLFPEFDVSDLSEALRVYQSRKRRFGT